MYGSGVSCVSDELVVYQWRASCVAWRVGCVWVGRWLRIGRELVVYGPGVSCVYAELVV